MLACVLRRSRRIATGTTARTRASAATATAVARPVVVHTQPQRTVVSGSAPTTPHRIKGSQRTTGSDAPGETKATWQKWINFDSPHKALSDQLNRKRHYFWYLDERGRLFRRELNYHAPLGELTMARVKNQLLSGIRYNTGRESKEHARYRAEGYRFVTSLGQELNFIASQDPLAAVVFHNLVPVSTPNPLHRTTTVGAFRAVGAAGAAIPPSEQYALLYGSSESVPFDPHKLRIFSGRLYYPFVRPGMFRRPRADAAAGNAVGPVNPVAAAQDAAARAVHATEAAERAAAGQFNPTDDDPDLDDASTAPPAFGSAAERDEWTRERGNLFGGSGGSSNSDNSPLMFGLLDRHLTQSLAIDDVLALQQRPAPVGSSSEQPPQYVFTWLGRQYALPPLPRLMLPGTYRAPAKPQSTAGAGADAQPQDANRTEVPAIAPRS